MKRFLLFAFLFMGSLWGQTMTVIQSNNPALGMTQDNPQLRGGRTIRIEGLPTGYEWPHWDYWLQRGNQKSSVGLLLFNGDVTGPSSVGPANLQVNSGNAYADIHEPIKLIVSCDLGTIRLREERWIRADCFKRPCPGDEPVEPPVPANRYVYLENDNIEIRFDLRACGAIDFISVQDGPNLVDSDDNGRLIQVDTMPNKACCEDNPWPDILYRRVSTPTQGGAYKQLPNWPISYEVSGDTFRATCRLINYWDVDSEVTPYRLTWTVELEDDSVKLNGEIFHNEATPQRVELASIWWFGSDYFQEIPEYPRWPVDQAFLETDSIRLDGIEFKATGKPILFWTNESTGDFSFDLHRPPGHTLTSGYRWWVQRDIAKDDYVTISAELDFSGMLEEEPPLDPERLQKVHAALIALIRELGHKKVIDLVTFTEFYNEELEKQK